jgi:hypothetical protein
MKSALQIFSWIAIVIGALAILGSISAEDGGSGLIGGVLFLTQGILAIAYISSQEEK